MIVVVTPSANLVACLPSSHNSTPSDNTAVEKVLSDTENFISNYLNSKESEINNLILSYSEPPSFVLTKNQDQIIQSTYYDHNSDIPVKEDWLIDKMNNYLNDVIISGIDAKFRTEHPTEMWLYNGIKGNFITLDYEQTSYNKIPFEWNPNSDKNNFGIQNYDQIIREKKVNFWAKFSCSLGIRIRYIASGSNTPKTKLTKFNFTLYYVNQEANSGAESAIVSIVTLASNNFSNLLPKLLSVPENGLESSKTANNKRYKSYQIKNNEFDKNNYISALEDKLLDEISKNDTSNVYKIKDIKFYNSAGQDNSDINQKGSLIDFSDIFSYDSSNQTNLWFRPIYEKFIKDNNKASFVDAVSKKIDILNSNFETQIKNRDQKPPDDSTFATGLFSFPSLSYGGLNLVVSPIPFFSTRLKSDGQTLQTRTEFIKQMIKVVTSLFTANKAMSSTEPKPIYYGKDFLFNKNTFTFSFNADDFNKFKKDNDNALNTFGSVVDYFNTQKVIVNTPDYNSDFDQSKFGLTVFDQNQNWYTTELANHKVDIDTKNYKYLLENIVDRDNIGRKENNIYYCYNGFSFFFDKEHNQNNFTSLEITKQ